MDTTFQGFFEARYGLHPTVTPLCHENLITAVHVSQTLPRRFCDFVLRCEEEPHLWEGVVVRGAELAAVEAACDEYFGTLSLAPGHRHEGGDLVTKFYGPVDPDNVTHAFWCTFGHAMGGVFVASRVTEAEISEG